MPVSIPFAHLSFCLAGYLFEGCDFVTRFSCHSQTDRYRDTDTDTDKTDGQTDGQTNKERQIQTDRHTERKETTKAAGLVGRERF